MLTFFFDAPFLLLLSILTTSNHTIQIRLSRLRFSRIVDGSLSRRRKNETKPKRPNAPTNLNHHRKQYVNEEQKHRFASLFYAIRRCRRRRRSQNGEIVAISDLAQNNQSKQTKHEKKKTKNDETSMSTGTAIFRQSQTRILLHHIQLLSAEFECEG